MFVRPSCGTSRPSTRFAASSTRTLVVPTATIRVAKVSTRTVSSVVCVSEDVLVELVCVLSLVSQICPACGRLKNKRMTLCLRDYRALPKAMQRALYDRVGHGYREAVVEALQFLNVEAGQVCGLIQDGVGYRGGEPVITLHMEAYLGAPESYDAVTIEGTPPLKMKLAGGVHGDIATASITVNSIPRVLAATPGLHTMRSLALPSFFGGKLG